MKKLLAPMFLSAALLSAGSMALSDPAFAGCKGGNCKRCATKGGKQHKNCQCKNCKHHEGESAPAPTETETGSKKAS